MDFEPRTITLTDGRAVLLRNATPDDAEAFCDHGRAVQATTDYVVTQPDEMRGPDETRERFTDLLARPGALILLALPTAPSDGTARAGHHREGGVVGDCMLVPWAERKMAHVAGIGMGLREDWRSAGLGTALLRAVVDHARAHPALLRLELGLYAENEPARRLYTRLGFVIEGTRPSRFQKRPGEFSDEVIMSLDVSAPEQR